MEYITNEVPSGDLAGPPKFNSPAQAALNPVLEASERLAFFALLALPDFLEYPGYKQFSVLQHQRKRLNRAEREDFKKNLRWESQERT